MTTILILDDNRVVLQMLGLVLRTKAGYQVLEAINQEEAAAQIERHQPEIDLLVADVCMDDGPGRAVAYRLAALCPQTRVLFISGYPKDHLVENGWLQPADHFLAKPFAPERLLRRVNEVLVSEPVPAALSAGAIRTACAGGAA